MKNDCEFEYIKESTSQEQVLAFYYKDKRYVLSPYKKDKWQFYFDDENKKENKNEIEKIIYDSLEAAFSKIRIDNKDLYQLLVIEQNQYEFV